MYLGHITITTCLHQLFKKQIPDFSYIYFLAGALFPDIMDKIFALFFGLTSRSIFHSLIVILIMSSLLLVVLSGHRKSTCAFTAGVMLHLLQDIPIDVGIVFWPFAGPLQYEELPDYVIRFHQYYIERHYPILWMIEMTSLPWFFAILINQRKSISCFFKKIFSVCNKKQKTT
ncbi:MAG: metal-dependent hydrolase [Pseudomonadota bacterium]